MSADEKTPPGCEPAGPGLYAVKDIDAFLDAICPTVQANLARVEDAATERSGEGWSGRLTCAACPVQIEGEVDGYAFYFRARWEEWSFGVSADKLTPDNDLPFDKAYRRPDSQRFPRTQAIRGAGFYAEGEGEGDGMSGSWMPYSEAWRHIEDSIAAFRKGRAAKGDPMSALVETLTTPAQVLRVEPAGSAPVTLIVVPLAGASLEVHGALNLPAGPAAVVTWISRSDLGHEDRGCVLLPPGAALELELFMSGLAQMQAHACAAALAEVLGWEEKP